MDGLLVIGIVCAVALLVILVAFVTRRKAPPPPGAVPGHTVAQRPTSMPREGGDGGGGNG